MVTGAPGEKQGGCHALAEARLTSLALILLEKAPSALWVACPARGTAGVPGRGQSLLPRRAPRLFIYPQRPAGP